jgi:hypothetical protein
MTVPPTYAITRIGFRGPADAGLPQQADTAATCGSWSRRHADWADARRLLRVCSRHGSRAAEAMPNA